MREEAFPWPLEFQEIAKNCTKVENSGGNCFWNQLHAQMPFWHWSWDSCYPCRRPHSPGARGINIFSKGAQREILRRSPQHILKKSGNLLKSTQRSGRRKEGWGKNPGQALIGPIDQENIKKQDSWRELSTTRKDNMSKRGKVCINRTILCTDVQKCCSFL